MNEISINTRMSILSVHEDIKKLSRVQYTDNKLVEACISHADEFSLKTKLYVVKQEQLKSYGPHRFLIYVSKSKDIIDKGIWYHHKHGSVDISKSVDENIALGNLYSYPDCCVNSFVADVKKFNWNLNKIFINTLKNSNSRIFPIYTNRLSITSPFHIHVPHSFECESTIRVGKQKMRVLHKYFKEYYPKAIEELKYCVLTDGEKIFKIKNFEHNNNRVMIKADDDMLSRHLHESRGLEEKLSSFLTDGTYEIDLNNDSGIEAFVFCKV